VAFIRFSPQTDDAEFFLQQILSRNAQQRILDAMSGNAITRLTLEKIRAFRIRRPPVTEQLRISAAVKAKTQVIGSLNFELKQALKLKSGLMDDLLTGRVRVTPLLDPQETPATV
jgi:type I restriction enzyme S subunit